MGEAQAIKPALLALSNAASLNSLNNIFKGVAGKVLNLLNFEVF